MNTGGATDLRRLIASLLVVRASGFLADHQRRYPRWELANAELRALLAQGVGGVILLGGSVAEVALRCQQLTIFRPESKYKPGLLSEAEYHAHA